MKNINKIFILTIIFFLAVGAVSATELDDATDDVSDMTSVDAPQVIETTNTVSDVDNTELNELNTEEETQICTGRTYSNPITITPNNYQTDMSNIYNYDAVEFSGTFTSTLTGGSISITSPIVFTSISGATFEDTQFVINSDDVTIKNLIIENDDGTSGSAISATGYDNIEVINNSITVTKTTAGETVGIKFNSTNNQTICGNNITMNIYPQYRWEEIPSTPYNIWLFHLYNSAIVVDDSYDVNIQYNIIISSNVTETEVNGTNEGINIRNSFDIDVNYNDITVNGGDFAYALTFEEVTTSNALNNVIEVNSENYGAGIQMIEVTDSEVSYNDIDVTSINTTEDPSSGEAFGYGIYMSTNWGPSQTTGNTVTYNNITVQSTIGYGIEGYIIDENVINYNNINMIGNVVMGIGLYNSSYNELYYNNISIVGNYRTLSSFYEQIPPQTTGIKIVGNDSSSVNFIENCIITVLDLTNTNPVYSIILEADLNGVYDNYLTSSNGLFNILIGDNSVLNSGTGNVISN